LLDEGETGVGAGAIDAAGLDVAGYAEVDLVGFVAHALKLGDGDVVLLGIGAGGDGQPGDGRYDEDAGEDELGRGLFLLHGFSLARVGKFPSKWAGAIALIARCPP